MARHKTKWLRIFTDHLCTGVIKPHAHQCPSWIEHWSFVSSVWEMSCRNCTPTDSVHGKSKKHLFVPTESRFEKESSALVRLWWTAKEKRIKISPEIGFFHSMTSSLSKLNADVTQNATQPLKVQLGIWVCYASRSYPWAVSLKQTHIFETSNFIPTFSFKNHLRRCIRFYVACQQYFDVNKESVSL